MLIIKPLTEIKEWILTPGIRVVSNYKLYVFYQMYPFKFLKNMN